MRFIFTSVFDFVLRHIAFRFGILFCTRFVSVNLGNAFCSRLSYSEDFLKCFAAKQALPAVTRLTVHCQSQVRGRSEPVACKLRGWSLVPCPWRASPGQQCSCCHWGLREPIIWQPKNGFLNSSYHSGLVEQSGVSSMLRIVAVHRVLARGSRLDMIMVHGVGFEFLKYVWTFSYRLKRNREFTHGSCIVFKTTK